MDEILLWAVQLQGQWRSISTELSQERPRGRPPNPSKRSGSCSATIEERDNIPPELVQADGEDVITTLMTICNKIWNGMANPMDPVLSHHTSQERQPAAVSDLSNNQPHQSTKQSYAEDHTEQIEATSGEDYRWRTGILQSRSSTYESSVRNISSTSKTSTTLSWTSRRPLTGFDMQLYEQPWTSTTSASTLSKSSKPL